MELFSSKAAVRPKGDVPSAPRTKQETAKHEALNSKQPRKREREREKGSAASEHEEEEAQVSSSVLVTRADLEAADAQDSTATATFASLGLVQWIQHSTSAMGFRFPTDIQRACISSILQGRDVIGCAETGSGKTAAFALPILQHLSEDPFGIFAIVLTPTRELGIQISEQFTSLGAPVGVRVSVIIGGVNMTEQGLQLAKRPHVVVATPGRLRHHLMGPDPPNLSKTRYLVLDEADRLLSDGFGSELEAILTAMSYPRRRTLLFSATITASLKEVEGLAMKDTLRFDLTREQRVPTTLRQEMLFLPARVKLCYLLKVLRNHLGVSGGDKDDRGEDGSGGGGQWSRKAAGGRGAQSSHKRKQLKASSKRAEDGDDIEAVLEAALAGAAAGGGGGASALALAGQKQSNKASAIVFVGSCQRCAEISTTLQELGIDCVALHSLMNQQRRLAALGKFKSSICRILIATDVASRGLDIPTVDLVVNCDLPRVAVDYVHRIGRTARAGRQGRAISLVTPHDVELLQVIEAHMGVKLEPSSEITDEDIVPLLNTVSKAVRAAQQQMLEQGFEEQAEVFQQRKKVQRKKLIRKRAKLAASSSEGAAVSEV